MTNNVEPARRLAASWSSSIDAVNASGRDPATKPRSARSIHPEPSPDTRSGGTRGASRTIGCQLRISYTSTGASSRSVCTSSLVSAPSVVFWPGLPNVAASLNTSLERMGSKVAGRGLRAVCQSVSLRSRTHRTPRRRSTSAIASGATSDEPVRASRAAMALSAIGVLCGNDPGRK